MSAPTDADLKLQFETERLIYREAHLLDTRQFEAWLALYREDAEYAIPAWLDETTLATDPDRELYLIYFRDKSGLDDRVYRINRIDPNWRRLNQRFDAASGTRQPEPSETR